MSPASSGLESRFDAERDITRTLGRCTVKTEVRVLTASPYRSSQHFLSFRPERVMITMSLEDIAADLCDEQITDEQIDDDNDRFHSSDDDVDMTIDTETYREASDIGL